MMLPDSQGGRGVPERKEALEMKSRRSAVRSEGEGETSVSAAHLGGKEKGQAGAPHGPSVTQTVLLSLRNNWCLRIKSSRKSVRSSVYVGAMST